MRNGRTLDKVRVLQPFLTQCTLKCGRIGGSRGRGGGSCRRSVGQRHGNGRYERHRGSAGVHRRATGRAVRTNATGWCGRGVQGTAAGAVTVNGSASATATTRTSGTGTGTSSTTATAAVGLA